VQRGVVQRIDAPQQRVSYGELIGGQQFKLTVSGNAPLKLREHYRLLGTAVPRADFGRSRHGQHALHPAERDCRACCMRGWCGLQGRPPMVPVRWCRA
jgi:hypothetical protein